MTRNFKAVSLAMLTVALAAIGVANASAAEFHCGAAPCRYTLKPDGVGTTAHHVFVIENSIGESVSVTCKKLEGEATAAGSTAPSLTFGNLKYIECNAAGEPVSIRMNSCQYKISASGTLTIQGCAIGKGIEAEITSTGCVFTFGEQGPLSGVGFTNLSSKKEMTMSMKFGMAGAIDGSEAACLINRTHPPFTGEYTTGNTILIGETEAGSQVNAWWE